MTQTVVFYHANCADGFGAAHSAYLALGNGALYHPMKYGQIEKPEDLAPFFNDPAEATVYILDFSFPQPATLWLMKSCKRVIWLDHHKTSFEQWAEITPQPNEHYVEEDSEGRVYIELDNARSGARIAWDHFHGTALEPIPMHIQHIDDYDRWQFNLPGTQSFNKALWSRAPWSFEQWDSLFIFDRSATDSSLEQFYTEGAAILRAHNSNVKSVVHGGARPCIIRYHGVETDGQPPVSAFSGLAVNCPPHLTSDSGHELAKKSSTFGLCWTLSKEGMIAKCSLRSVGDYDVSAIARAFGGGGHKNAAGFEVPIETLLSWLRS